MNLYNQVSIVKIDIKNLFGIYDYTIPLKSMDISKLLILYGENGAGKTTILQMIFNLLSCQRNQGHKSDLANTKFEEISIYLSNEYKVSAYRKNDLVGNYNLLLERPNEKIIDVSVNAFIVNDFDKYIVKGTTPDSLNTPMELFLLELSKINLSLHYLSDDRKIKSNISLIIDEKDNSINLSELPLDVLKKLSRSNFEEKFSLSDTFLELAISRVEAWFKHQVYIANSIGQSSGNTIFINLMEKLLSSEVDSNFISSRISKNEILIKLEQLKIRNEEFIKYNIITDFNLNKLIPLINKFPEEKINLIESTLNPYISSIENKFDALEEIKTLIDVFITTLSDFYKGKIISYSVEEGIKIVSKYNSIGNLSLKMLSSGEKQLLLLFCNTITAKDKASIFIIDEPELSLNVTWQRKLISALESFAKGSSIQFIFATHSIELLSQYDNNVCDLINEKSE